MLFDDEPQPQMMARGLNINGDDDEEPSPVKSAEAAQVMTTGVLSVVEPPSDLSVVFYLQAVVALGAQVVHNTGGWVLIDQYIPPPLPPPTISTSLHPLPPYHIHLPPTTPSSQYILSNIKKNYHFPVHPTAPYSTLRSMVL